MPEARRRELSRLCALLFAGVLALSLLLAQRRLYGDDVWFVRCIVQEQPFASHFLYMPLARRFARLCAWAAGLDPFRSLRVLAALGAASAAALLCAAALRRGARAGAAALFALLPLASASGVFFATTGELHTLHLAALGLCAWCAARLGPDVPARRMLALGLAYGVVVGTHQSGALLLPGVLAFALLALRGRPPRSLARDAAAFALAGALSLAAMRLCHGLEAALPGAGAGGGDVLGPMLAQMRAGLAQRWRELGARDLALYLARDGVASACGPILAGAAAWGFLCRRRPALGAALAAALVPYGLFFPLFHFPERGAYFLVTLPFFAGALLAALCGAPRVAPRAIAPVLALAGALAPLRAEELEALLGPLGPLVLALALFALGLALPPARAGAPAPRAPLVLTAALLALTLAGGLRARAAYDRETPVLDWTRAVCEEAGGRDVVLITCGFQEYWLLVLLRSPWPGPLAGTWAFAEALPHPTPAPFLYGDSTVPRAELEAGVAERVARGGELWLDRRVADQVDERARAAPAIAADLDLLRRRYRLEPFERGPFRAWRVLAP